MIAVMRCLINMPIPSRCKWVCSEVVDMAADSHRSGSYSYEYYVAHRKRILKTQKKYRALHHVTSRKWEYRIEREYGITAEQYHALLESQGGVCYVCHRKEEYRLCIRYNHKTGAVVGLLCHRCNMFLGRIEKKINDPNMSDIKKMRISQDMINVLHRDALKELGGE